MGSVQNTEVRPSLLQNLERFGYAVFVAIVACLPFEFRIVPLATNLQLLFVVSVVLFLPIVARKSGDLLRERIVLTALLFVATQWIAALLAPDFRRNALLGAVRVSVGFVLLCITLCIREHKTIFRVWCLSAILAAIYGLLDYAGFGFHHLFRMDEFYVGEVRRLSGSFEYPNTAAAFFGMSLPIVWNVKVASWKRFAGTILVWIALLLTYSRGAIIAVLLTMIVWAIITKSRSFVFCGLLCLIGFVGAVAVQPFLFQRFKNTEPAKSLSAKYEPAYNTLVRSPGETDSLLVRITNTGTSSWMTTGQEPFTITYRWYDPENLEVLHRPPSFTPIPGPLAPKRSIDVRASFVTPSNPGLYLLTWDISQHGKNWFSGNGVLPGVVQVDVQTGADDQSRNTDISRWYQHPISRMLVGTFTIKRTDLWKAALELTRYHPFFGVGPDNFRLLYGDVLHLKRPDAKIRSNSLYLELLCGSGLAGLLAFGKMIVTPRRSTSLAAISLTIFLVHSTVDVFLMTTPIYFAFWILLGLAHQNYSETQAWKASAT